MTDREDAGEGAEDLLKDLPAEILIEDVDALKAMAHPVRVSILKTLYEPAPDSKLVPARSAKMICEQLGESRTTRIYHHIKLMLAAGLIQKVRTEQVGNISEDYFGPSARLIRLSPELLQSAQMGDGTGWLDAIVSLLDATRQDLNALPASTPVRDMRFSHHEFKVPASKAREFRERLDDLFRDLSAASEDGDDGDDALETFRTLFIVYPME